MFFETPQFHAPKLTASTRAPLEAEAARKAEVIFLSRQLYSLVLLEITLPFYFSSGLSCMPSITVWSD